MKDKKEMIVFILVFFILLTVNNYYNNHQELEIISASGYKTDNWYSESIIVLADKSLATDYERCASEIIQHVLENDFKEIDFSFCENGYANNLAVTVYISKAAL